MRSSCRSSSLFIALAFLAVTSINFVAAESSGKESNTKIENSDFKLAVDCKEKGFALVVCSDCDKLAEFTNNIDMIDECQMCCHERSDNGKFAQGILRYGMWTLRDYPGLKGFLESLKSRPIENLYASSERRSTPVLEMKDVEGKSKFVNIDGWKEEHFFEFFEEKL